MCICYPGLPFCYTACFSFTHVVTHFVLLHMLPVALQTCCWTLATLPLLVGHFFFACRFPVAAVPSMPQPAPCHYGTLPAALPFLTSNAWFLITNRVSPHSLGFCPQPLTHYRRLLLPRRLGRYYLPELPASQPCHLPTYLPQPYYRVLRKTRQTCIMVAVRLPYSVLSYTVRSAIRAVPLP